ncbi:hypothetical protein SAMN05421595_1758 [Austwickia chelonae]|uniref:Uncharacterized protein n=1 Tax=Austwickia chelonae NBRC 105200 TaxID=1184607 RepID=K6VMN5_9MICO|nr:hypothetical protein [Austwickia chelonae]GAB76625.1 hypothetical protein AUCHE_01_01870 [Austwickia chelonae NBRC 105200]SEW28260.1 hypothetical protein SAMN05421595_1758 [Austwickia chelonae]
MPAPLRTIAVVAVASTTIAFGGSAAYAAPFENKPQDSAVKEMEEQGVTPVHDESGKLVGYSVKQDARETLDKLSEEIKREEKPKEIVKDLDDDSKKALEKVVEEVKTQDAKKNPAKDIRNESADQRKERLEKEKDEQQKALKEFDEKDKDAESKDVKEVLKAESAGDISEATFETQASKKGSNWWRVAKCTAAVGTFLAVTVFTTAKAAGMVAKIASLVKTHGIKAVAKLFTGGDGAGMGKIGAEIRDAVAKEKAAFQTMKSCFQKK